TRSPPSTRRTRCGRSSASGRLRGRAGAGRQAAPVVPSVSPPTRGDGMGELGIIGVGAMGGPMWRRLHERGRRGVVCDVSAAATDELAAEGATVAESPAALAQQCTTILLSLPTSAHVEDVALGPKGIASTAEP